MSTSNSNTAERERQQKLELLREKQEKLKKLNELKSKKLAEVSAKNVVNTNMSNTTTAAATATKNTNTTSVDDILGDLIKSGTFEQKSLDAKYKSNYMPAVLDAIVKTAPLSKQDIFKRLKSQTNPEIDVAPFVCCSKKYTNYFFY